MPNALNCTRPQFGQLVNERILTPISGGGQVARGRTQKSFDSRQVGEFLRQLHDRAEPVAAKPKGFFPIAEAAGKAKVPCVDIVHLILGGFLENVLRLVGAEGYAALLVNAAEVKKLTKTVMIGLSAADAFEALSVPPSTGWTLVDRRDELRLKSVVIEGATGYRFHRFDRGEVDAYARRFFIVDLYLVVDLPSSMGYFAQT